MNPQHFSLECVDRYGTSHTFPCVLETEEGEPDLVHCRVFPCGIASCVTCWFVCSIRRLTPQRYRIDMIDRMRREFGGLGIPDALLPKLCHLLEIEIVSSLADTRDAEWRTDLAEEMWRRLVRKRIASYLPEQDRYVCPGR